MTKPAPVHWRASYHHLRDTVIAPATAVVTQPETPPEIRRLQRARQLIVRWPETNWDGVKPLPDDGTLRLLLFREGLPVQKWDLGGVRLRTPRRQAEPDGGYSLEVVAEYHDINLQDLGEEMQ